MTTLINTLPAAKMTRALEVGKFYLRADGGIVKIVEKTTINLRRPFKAVRLCSGKAAGYYSKLGSKCRRKNGDAKPEKGLNIVGEIVQ